MEDILRRMGERGDIIRTMQRAFTQRTLRRVGIHRELMTAAAR